MVYAHRCVVYARSRETSSVSRLVERGHFVRRAILGERSFREREREKARGRFERSFREVLSRGRFERSFREVVSRERERERKRECVYVYVRACVRVCGRERERSFGGK